MNDIFLSAGVPGPDDEIYFETADPLLIHSAVRSLCSLVFGRLRIVWGGHPAITPMMWAACENMGIQYASAVQLYQSRFYEEMYPQENRRFRNVTYTKHAATEQESLSLMRKTMLSKRHRYVAGVFIGGKEGVVKEFELFRHLHGSAKAIVFPSTGGAAAILGRKFPQDAAPAGDFVDFLEYLAERIDVPPLERTTSETAKPKSRKPRKSPRDG